MFERERDVAVSAVREASRMCQAVQQRLVAGHMLEKGDKSPVTVADYGAQAVVSHLLEVAFPADPLVGEEDAAALREGQHAALRDKVVDGVRSVLADLSADQVLAAIDRGVYGGGRAGRHWTLDPIDGTKGFLRLDQYAVALALIEDGVPVLGVLGCPNLPHDARDPDGGRGCMFTAVRGHGATIQTLDGGDERAITVDAVASAGDAVFCESVEKAHSSQSDAARIAELLGITRPPYRIDSQCKYAAVARGDASIYLRLPTRADYVEKIWDHAAGVRVILEAGGEVTDIHGRPLDFGLGRGLSANKGVIVTNGRLHAPVLAAVKQVLGL